MGKNTSLIEKYRTFRKEPIKENCIVFESLWGRSYNCSPAAFYEYILANHPEYECIWFLNDVETTIKGNAKKVERKTEEFYHYLATAKYFVYNTNLPLSFVKRDGQVVIQTMHGTPFKTFGLDVTDEISTEKERLRAVKRADMWDYLVAQGEFTKGMAWRWFRYRNNILETGYPRTDKIYLAEKDETIKLKNDLGIPKDKKIILYAPTWRDLNSFDMELDINTMKDALSDEYVLLIRPHYFVAEFYKVPEDGKFVFDAGRVSSIEDLYPATDILITDYSSVMFDFALTGKPMIFYAYDLTEYTENTRGSYFDISSEAPGCLAQTTEEVIDSIKNLDTFYDIHGERIQAFRQKYLTYENDRSSETIFNAVFVRKEQDGRVLMRKRIEAVAKCILPHKIYACFMRKSMKRALNNVKHSVM